MSNPERLAYRIAEFAAVVGISRSKAYEGVASGQVPTIEIAGCRRVPAEYVRQEIEKALAGRTTEAA